ncbi:hypothetical protein BD560DRAFT_427465 [Blakeslea trispora]|nr:hypothetical protein BD560DRAFT_427465 [Blakeslea trispora]
MGVTYLKSFSSLHPLFSLLDKPIAIRYSTLRNQLLLGSQQDMLSIVILFKMLPVYAHIEKLLCDMCCHVSNKFAPVCFRITLYKAKGMKRQRRHLKGRLSVLAPPVNQCYFFFPTIGLKSATTTQSLMAVSQLIAIHLRQNLVFIYTVSRNIWDLTRETKAVSQLFIAGLSLKQTHFE